MARIRGRAEKELPEAPSQYDSYTALLAISLLATLTGLLFMALDYSDYSAKVPRLTTPASISQAAEQQGGGPGSAIVPPAATPKRPAK